MFGGLVFLLLACDPWVYDHVLQRVYCEAEGETLVFEPVRGMRPVLIYDHEGRALDVDLIATDGFE